MTEKERELALYCLKASSDYHSEVCEECIIYPNCDHTIQDDVTETIIKTLEQESCEDAISRQTVLDMMQMKMGGKELYKAVYDLPPVTPTRKSCSDCIIDGTDACSRGAGRTIDEPCENFIADDEEI